MPVIKAVRYRPDLTFEDIRFYPPTHVHRSIDINPALRTAHVVFDNGCRVDISTTFYEASIPFFEHTYFLHDISRAEHAQYDLNLFTPRYGVRNKKSIAEVMEILAYVAGLPDTGETQWEMIEVKKIVYPETFYTPEFHGSFIYCHEHASDDRLFHVLLPWWDNIPYKERASSILERTHWCLNNCAGKFAWTCAGPVWAFRKYEDAVAFRLTWS
jgi:hypothetical protein